MSVLSRKSARARQRVRIESSFGGITLNLEAVVVRRKRSRQGYVLGLRFADLDPSTRQKLEEVVRTMQVQTALAQQACVFFERLPQMEAPEAEPNTERVPHQLASPPAAADSSVPRASSSVPQVDSSVPRADSSVPQATPWPGAASHPQPVVDPTSMGSVPRAPYPHATSGPHASADAYAHAQAHPHASSGPYPQGSPHGVAAQHSAPYPQGSPHGVAAQHSAPYSPHPYGSPSGYSPGAYSYPQGTPSGHPVPNPAAGAGQYSHGPTSGYPAAGASQYSHGATSGYPAAGASQYSHGPTSGYPAADASQYPHGPTSGYPAADASQYSHGATGPHPVADGRGYPHPPTSAYPAADPYGYAQGSAAPGSGHGPVHGPAGSTPYGATDPYPAQAQPGSVQTHRQAGPGAYAYSGAQSQATMDRYPTHEGYPPAIPSPHGPTPGGPPPVGSAPGSGMHHHPEAHAYSGAVSIQHPDDVGTSSFPHAGTGQYPNPGTGHYASVGTVQVPAAGGEHPNEATGQHPSAESSAEPPSSAYTYHRAPHDGVPSAGAASESQPHWDSTMVAIPEGYDPSAVLAAPGSDPVGADEGSAPPMPTARPTAGTVVLPGEGLVSERSRPQSSVHEGPVVRFGEDEGWTDDELQTQAYDDEPDWASGSPGTRTHDGDGEGPPSVSGVARPGVDADVTAEPGTFVTRTELLIDPMADTEARVTHRTTEPRGGTVVEPSPRPMTAPEAVAASSVGEPEPPPHLSLPTDDQGAVQRWVDGRASHAEEPEQLAPTDDQSAVQQWADGGASYTEEPEPSAPADDDSAVQRWADGGASYAEEPELPPVPSPIQGYLGDAAPFDPFAPVELDSGEEPGLPAIGEDEPMHAFEEVSGLYRSPSVMESAEARAQATSPELSLGELAEPVESSLVIALAELTDADGEVRDGWLAAPADEDRTEVQPTTSSATIPEISSEQWQVASLEPSEQEDTNVGPRPAGELDDPAVDIDYGYEHKGDQGDGRFSLEVDAEVEPEPSVTGDTQVIVLGDPPMPDFGSVGAPEGPITGSTVVMHIDDVGPGPSSTTVDPEATAESEPEEPARTGATMVVDVRDLFAQAESAAVAQAYAADWGAQVPDLPEAPAAAVGSAFDLQDLLSRFDAAGTEVELITPESERLEAEAEPPEAEVEPPESVESSDPPVPSTQAPQLPDKLQEALAKLRRRDDSGAVPAAVAGAGATEGDDESKTQRRRSRRRRRPAAGGFASNNDSPELVALYRQALADLETDEATS